MVGGSQLAMSLVTRLPIFARASGLFTAGRKETLTARNHIGGRQLSVPFVLNIWLQPSAVTCGMSGTPDEGSFMYDGSFICEGVN